MKFIVTAPEGADLVSYSQRAREGGADMLEIRTDLPPVRRTGDIEEMALPVLYALRSEGVVDSFLMKSAELLDLDYTKAGEEAQIAREKRMVSWHSSTQKDADSIVQLLKAHNTNALAVKYVEPLSDDYSSQLINLEAARVALSREFAVVTMLVTGRGALPLRRKLAENNDLYYCALDADDRAAEGQGILAEELEYFRNRSE